MLCITQEEDHEIAVHEAAHQQLQVVVDVSDGVDSGTVNSSELTKMEGNGKEASAEVAKQQFEERAL